MNCKKEVDGDNLYFGVRIQVIQKAVKPMLCKHLGELWQNPHSH